MRLTRFGFHGLVFYTLMLGAFFASPYSNLFFLLLGFLTLLGAMGIVAAHRNLRGLRAELGPLPQVPSDVGIQLPLELFAPGPMRFQVGARLSLEGGQELFGLLDMVDGRGTLMLGAQGLARGCYPVSGARLESTHPFGILRLRRSFEAPAELVVYPAPRSLVEGRSAASLDELLGCEDPGPGDLQPSGLRDHREGDGIRRVHWRASARRARLVVQEWEGGSGQGLEVVLDRRCAPEDLEEALRTLSACVHLARTNKETLRIHSQGLSATFGESHQPWSEALRFLASTRVLPEDGAEPPATSPAVARLPPQRSLDTAHA